MAATPVAPTNYAYTRHMLAIATTGTLAEVLTVVLPCAWIYADIGRQLVGQTPPASDHPYAEWLAMYASPDFDAVEIWLRTRLDHHASDHNQEQQQRLFAIFRESTRYEWLFWEMAWNLEVWPA
jgi:thiaminase/transcriptional activator TenA